MKILHQQGESIVIEVAATYPIDTYESINILTLEIRKFVRNNPFSSVTIARLSNAKKPRRLEMKYEEALALAKAILEFDAKFETEHPA